MSTQPPPPPPPGDNQGYGYGQQPPGPGQGYGYTSAPGPKPPSNLVWAILTTLLCCLPFGVVSIVYAAQVDGKYNSGDYAGAQNSSQKARTWAIAAAVTGLVVGVVWAAVVLAAGSDSTN